MDEVAWVGRVCKEKMLQTRGCSAVDSRSRSSQLSGQALSAHGVSLGQHQISGLSSSGFNCQLEQVPEMIHSSSANPHLSCLQCVIPSLLQEPGMLLPCSGPPGHHNVMFCSPAYLSCDKHGHSLRSSKSPTDRDDPRERAIPRAGKSLPRVVGHIVPIPPRRAVALVMERVIPHASATEHPAGLISRLLGVPQVWRLKFPSEITV